MHWERLLLNALLFAVFVPGVLVTLPPGGSKWVVLAVHGLLFAFLSHRLALMVFPRK